MSRASAPQRWAARDHQERHLAALQSIIIIIIIINICIINIISISSSSSSSSSSIILIIISSSSSSSICISIISICSTIHYNNYVHMIHYQVIVVSYVVSTAMC